ncbi:MAG TPA: SAM-dependent methyltransferase [Zeimonas sp.]
MSVHLEAPPEEALAVSRELVRRIGAEVDAAGGWIGFDRYMHRALYEPGMGYYAGSNRVFGTQGDFVTAPEMSPLFGRCVAVQCAQWLDAAGGDVVEFGAGSGALAAQILSSLRAADALPRIYAIVELSGSLRERQRRTIAAAGPELLDRVRWLDALPERIDGVVVANEVLDAMPVRVFRAAGDTVFERGVARAGVDALGWSERPADARLAALVQQRLREAQSAYSGDTTGRVPVAADYVSELGEQAEAWVETVGARITQGAMLLVDYGFPRHEFYHPQRDAGTLRCHFRHRAHDDPFLWPGLQDITAHVDFTAVAESAARARLDVLGFASQARFLLDCGLLDTCAAIPRDDLRSWTRATQAVQRLLSEAEMGELFKAIAFGRGVPDDAIGFRTRDRRASL